MSDTIRDQSKSNFIRDLIVRSDQMSASIVVSKPPRAAVGNVKKEIISLLASKGITYGVLDQAIDLIFDQELYNQVIEVARGIYVVHGNDSFIVRRSSELEKKEVNVNLDPNLVSEGDIIFDVVPATLGSHGINIFGNVSFANPGKELSISLGSGVFLSNDNSSISASRSGYLKVDEQSVDVIDMYVIEGSVNRYTGNIVFGGSVHVKGDVCTGYSITADHDVIVDGLVEAATIISGSNIMVNKGLIGAGKAVLVAKENITTDFIENAFSVEAGKSIYTNLVLNSNLYAMDSVIVSNDGQIIGGKTIAHNQIVCKTAGFRSYVKTELVVGQTKDRLEQMEETQRLIKELNELNNEVRKNIIYLENKVQSSTAADDKNNILNEQLMAFSYRNGVLFELQERLNTLKEKTSLVAKIMVSDEILPMTKVRVNDKELLIQEHMKHRCIFADENEILIIDLDDCFQ